MPAMLLLLVLALFSCNTAVPMTSAAASTSSTPRIEITTEGGFAGKGLGSVTIDGRSVAAKDLAHTCTGELTEKEQETIARAAAAFKASSDSAPAHPDQIGYTLTVGDQSTSWYGEEAPKAAAPLFNAVWAARQRVLKSCR
jgi:hypothetical protein